MGFEIVAITVVDFLAAELLLLQFFFQIQHPYLHSYKNVAFAFSTFNQEKSTFCKLQSHEILTSIHLWYTIHAGKHSTTITHTINLPVLYIRPSII